jgi:hypothetical protein
MRRICGVQLQMESRRCKLWVVCSQKWRKMCENARCKEKKIARCGVVLFMVGAWNETPVASGKCAGQYGNLSGLLRVGANWNWSEMREERWCVKIRICQSIKADKFQSRKRRILDYWRTAIRTSWVLRIPTSRLAKYDPSRDLSNDQWFLLSLALSWPEVSHPIEHPLLILDVPGMAARAAAPSRWWEVMIAGREQSLNLEGNNNLPLNYLVDAHSRVKTSV